MTAAAGWQLDGTFLRGNTDFDAINGALWTQDLSASIKIIAARHDNHDEVLSKGIEATLNLDGLNTMRANLNMGGFKITGVGAATLVGDVPLYGQLAGSMTFAADVLTLNDRDGNAIDTVSIPTGGGGTGTVTGITAGVGLAGGTINVAGTISLEELNPGQTHSGGIAGIVVDSYGRVTQVTTGAFANTDLGNEPGGVNVTVTSSTGANTTIGAATAGVAGVMSSTQAGNLADSLTDIATLQAEVAALQAASGGSMKPPISLFGIGTVATLNVLSGAVTWTQQQDNGVKNTDGYINVVSHTGSGTIEFLGIELKSTPASNTIGFKFIVDGVELVADVDTWKAADGTDTPGNGLILAGSLDGSQLGGLGQIKFNDSFQLQVNALQSTDAIMTGYYRYQVDG